MSKELHINPLVKIDSFALLAPINQVQIIDSKYLEKYSRVYQSGEVEESETFYNNSQHRELNGIKYKVSKVQRIWNGQNEEFIQIVFTAKMLKNAYFNGINLQNIETRLKGINELKIINIGLNTALSSFVTDVDICKDFKLKFNEFKDLTLIVNQNVIFSKRKHIRTFLNSLLFSASSKVL